MVQCDSCDHWLHLSCSGVLSKDLKNIDVLKCFICCVKDCCATSASAVVLSIRQAIKNQSASSISSKRKTRTSKKAESAVPDGNLVDKLRDNLDGSTAVRLSVDVCQSSSGVFPSCGEVASGGVESCTLPSGGVISSGTVVASSTES